MPSQTTTERLRGLVLSANDLKSLTDWPDALIEDYLNIIDNLVVLSNLAGIQIYSIPANESFESRISELEHKLLSLVYPILPDLESIEQKMLAELYNANPSHGSLSGLSNDDHIQYVLRNQWLQNGFVDKSELSLVWSDAAPRTVTLDSVGAFFRYFHDGVMYTETDALVTTIDNTAGIHAIYINGEGSMTSLANPSETQIDSIIVNECVVAFVMWDGTDGRLIFEFHGYKMSPETHHWIHDNIGAVYKEGSALADFTIDDDGDHNIDAQFSVGSGEFYDEDLEVEIDALAVGDGMEIWYLDGAVWKWATQGVAPNAFSVLSDLVGAGRLAYNNAGAQTECTNQYYVLCHVFSTNVTADTYDGKGRYIAIQGQAQYATKALARAGAETEINTLVYGTLPLPEIAPIATVIFQTSTAPAFANAVKATTISTGAGDNYIDWRGSALKATGGSVADHGALAGLSDDDHPQYIKDTEFTADSEILVGTGVGTFQKESGATLRTSIGCDASGELAALATKNPPIDADKVIYRDSVAADALVTSTWTQVKAFLKTYLDTLYATLGVNANITSMTGLDNDGIPVAKVSGAIETAGLAAAVIADHYLVRGDGGVRGVQDSTIIVSDDGEMNNPSQPCFLANITADQTLVTGDGTLYSIQGAIWTERFDQNSDFAAGTFTAPVTGRYQINATVEINGLTSSHTSGHLYIITSNRSYLVEFLNPWAVSISSYYIMKGSLILDMDATDTCYLRVIVSNGAKVVNVKRDQTTFSGALIC